VCFRNAAEARLIGFIREKRARAVLAAAPGRFRNWVFDAPKIYILFCISEITLDNNKS
jgi:hypothetical protein